MLNIKQLNGMKLKKDLDIVRVVKRYHNKNKSGGNFGINLITGGKENLELSGYHDLDGNIFSMRLGILWSLGSEIIRRDNYQEWTYERLIETIKRLPYLRKTQIINYTHEGM